MSESVSRTVNPESLSQKLRAQIASILKLSMKKFYDNCSASCLLCIKYPGNRKKYNGVQEKFN
jgi:hypothetical protein